LKLEAEKVMWKKVVELIIIAEGKQIKDTSNVMP